MTRIAVFQKNKNDVRRNLRMAIGTAKNINIKELDAFLQTVSFIKCYLAYVRITVNVFKKIYIHII